MDLFVNDPLPPLNWLRAFHIAARYNNFSHAAQELGVTQTAISHHIRNLEMHLGTTLFKRQARGVTLTEHGVAYLPTVKFAFESLSDATNELFGEGSDKPLVVKCPTSFSHTRLMPILFKFIEKYPEIALRVELWHQPFEHDFSDIDIEIRFGLGDWANVEATSLCSLIWAPCCAPALLQKYGPLDNVADLCNWPLVSMINADKGWKQWFHTVGLQDVSFRPVLQVDAVSLAMQAALSGYVVALCTQKITTIDLHEGRLIELHPHTITSAESMYIVTAKGAMRRPNVLAFVNWLKSEMV